MSSPSHELGYSSNAMTTATMSSTSRAPTEKRTDVKVLLSFPMLTMFNFIQTLMYLLH
jgi:hypothetical protein